VTVYPFPDHPGGSLPRGHDSGTMVKRYKDDAVAYRPLSPPTSDPQDAAMELVEANDRPSSDITVSFDPSSFPSRYAKANSTVRRVSHIIPSFPSFNAHGSLVEKATDAQAWKPPWSS
jgi:hypothetical protein